MLNSPEFKLTYKTALAEEMKKRSIPTLISHIVMSLILMGLNRYNSFVSPVLLATFWVLISLNIFRWFSIRRPISDEQWLKLFTLMIAGMATCWSVIIYHYLVLTPYLGFFLLAGVTSAASYSLGPNRRDYLIFQTAVIGSGIGFMVTNKLWVVGEQAPTLLLIVFYLYVLRQQLSYRSEWRELVRNRIEIDRQRYKLQTSAKMAALGEMAGGLAHEINNPLTIIHGHCVLLNRQIGSNITLSEAKHSIEVISNTTLRIATIVRGLRNFARDAGEDPFHKASLQDIIKETLSFCEARLRHKEITLKIHNLSEDILLECRATQISQVLLNLLNNSHDAIEKLEKKWIEIEIQNRTDSLKILVTDSGPGIPNAIRERIMQPFFTTKEVGQGTGLGLSLSRGIIEDHGGQLYFDFKHANTRVVIELPKVQGG